MRAQLNYSNEDKRIRHGRYTIKLLLSLLGVLCLGFGCVGFVLPILPTTPFFLVAAFCFAKSSERLHLWFLGTKLYHKHLESFTKNRSMPLKTKLSIMITVTVLLAVSFCLLDGILAGQIVLVLVWLFHMVYFLFRVKTSRG